MTVPQPLASSDDDQLRPIDFVLLPSILPTMKSLDFISFHTTTTTNRITPADFRNIPHNPLRSNSSSRRRGRRSGSLMMKLTLPMSLPTSTRSSPPPSPHRVLQRTMSLPTKLDQAPRTKKLFWFLPNLHPTRGTETRWTRRMSTMDPKRHDETREEFMARPSSCSAHLLASFENDSSTLEGSDYEDFVEDLVGLGILVDE